MRTFVFLTLNSWGGGGTLPFTRKSFQTTNITFNIGYGYRYWYIFSLVKAYGLNNNRCKTIPLTLPWLHIRSVAPLVSASFSALESTVLTEVGEPEMVAQLVNENCNFDLFTALYRQQFHQQTFFKKDLFSFIRAQHILRYHIIQDHVLRWYPHNFRTSDPDPSRRKRRTRIRQHQI